MLACLWFNSTFQSVCRCEPGVDWAGLLSQSGHFSNICGPILLISGVNEKTTKSRGRQLLETK